MLCWNNLQERPDIGEGGEDLKQYPGAVGMGVEVADQDEELEQPY